MKRALLVLLLFFSLSAACSAEREVIVQIKDPRGDDRGAGALAYPEHPVYVAGLFDLLTFEVSLEHDHVYLDFQFAELTNPFGSPEGFFHQRLEVYIKTETDVGQSEIEFGNYKLRTHPDFGWNLRLSIAPFGETQLYKGEELVASGENISCFVLPDGKTIRLKVSKNLLPHPNPAWGYYVLVGAFDGLAKDYWRDVGEGPWQVGGTGIPVFDLLVPRFSLNGQNQQLSKGILYPASRQEFGAVAWSAMGFVLAIAGFFLWRWTFGRT